MGRINIVETDISFNGPLTGRSVTNYFVVHHVGDINRDVSAEEIDSWHKNNGWLGIGYHYVIRKDGSVERGRPRDTIGSHCVDHNFESIGINVVGDFQGNEPEEAQVKSLVDLLADLCDIYGLTPSRDTIVGHRELNETECPGDNLFNKLDDIVEKVKVAVANPPA